MSSPWSLPKIDERTLDSDQSADVCVIGAGLSGLLTAYRLIDAGRSVVVLDRAGVGTGETGRTTAHLTAVLDERYQTLAKMHGQSSARILAESHTAAIAFIEQTAAKECIECDFRRVDAFLYESGDEREPSDAGKQLEKELAAAREAGLRCELVERVPLPGFSGRALRVLDQADFHPTRFLNGVARAFLERGGRIFAPARAQSVTQGETCEVRTTNGRTVRAKHVVVATHTPVNDVVTMHTKQAPYRTYAIACPIASEAVPPGLYWDLADPYHYVRTERIDDASALLIVGGEDHKVGHEEHPERRWERLEAWTRKHFPMAGAREHRWSGQVFEPADEVAFIGRNPGSQNVYIATGHSGNGMTYSAIAALLIPDLIEGRDNAWWELYDPARKPLGARALATFAKENLDVAGRYGDWLTRGTANSPDQIPPGEGAVLRRGMHLLAVYVDDQGKVHERSAKCTHLGCVVAWNRAEKSWDCPCHGSRFDPKGRVLVGPAVEDLEAAPQTITAPGEHARR